MALRRPEGVDVTAGAGPGPAVDDGPESQQGSDGMSPVSGHGVNTASTYAPALDGLRAFASLLVITLHVGIFTGQVPGFGEEGPLGPVISRFAVAVPIFFVISGLLLYRPWAEAALERRDAPQVRAYYWHRLLRIFPAFWVAALVGLLLFERDRLGDVWRTVRIGLLVHIYDRQSMPMSLSPTWSLATEVAFYALLPLLAFLLHRVLTRPGGVRVALSVLLGLTVLGVGWVIWVNRSPDGARRPLEASWLPAYIGYFAAGMAMALYAAHTARSSRRSALVRAVTRAPWLCWVMALAGYVLVSTPVAGGVAEVPTTAQAVTEHLAYLVTAVGLVTPLALATGVGPERLMSRPIIVWLGRISYGSFLWHMIVIEEWMEITDKRLGTLGTKDFVALFPITVAATLTLGWLSYRLVEQPARRLRTLVGKGPTAMPREVLVADES